MRNHNAALGLRRAMPARGRRRSARRPRRVAERRPAAASAGGARRAARGLRRGRTPVMSASAFSPIAAPRLAARAGAARGGRRRGPAEAMLAEALRWPELRATADSAAGGIGVRMRTRSSGVAPPQQLCAAPRRLPRCQRAANASAAAAAAAQPPRLAPPRRSRARHTARAAADEAATQPPPARERRASTATAAAAAAAAEPQAQLWAARPAGSHPAAYDDDPPFAALPALNDAALRARLGVGGVAAGRPLRARRLAPAATAAAFPGDHPYERCAAARAAHAGTRRAAAGMLTCALVRCSLARAVAARTAIDAKEFAEALELFHRVRRRVRRATVVECVARSSPLHALPCS
jgi:hypothetical protein